MRYSSVLGPAVFIMEMELLKNPSVGYRSDESITFKLELSTQFYLTTISLRCFLKYSSFDTSVPDCKLNIYSCQRRIMQRFT